jgi:Fe-S cluster assembly protein SufD
MSAPLLDALRETFDALPASRLAAGGLGAARRAQFDAALADGLPGARAERWRYTPLRALERRRFGRADALPDIDPASVPAANLPRLVFVNGVYAPALSRVDGLSDGVALYPLSQLLETGDARDAEFLARRFPARDETFARLNAALALDGLVVRVAAGVRVATPLALVMLGAPAGGDVAVHLRHLVELGDGAELTLVEYQAAAAPQAHLVNSLVQAHLRTGARLSHVRVQREDAGASVFARTDAALASEAHYARVDLELGAALSRHELNIALQGRGARAASNGVLLADGKRHVDTRLAIDHAAPDTRCDLVWRGLAADRGRGVFHGGILIRPGADGAAAHLSNKNLLLSPHAEIDTQPVLEIHADEVQASHGATVGQLDERALFYLRSRGVPEGEARALLTAAFCAVVLDAIADADLRASLDAELSARLPQVAA